MDSCSNVDDCVVGGADSIAAELLFVIDEDLEELMLLKSPSIVIHYELPIFLKICFGFEA